MFVNKKWLISLLLICITTVMVACSDNDSTEGNEKTSTEEGNQQAEMEQPDLENVPEVVAEVNGDKISKADFESTYQAQFQQVMMQAQMSGEEVNQDELKGQIVDALIGQRLVIQEAEDKGFEVAEEDVNKTLDSLVAQNGLESQDEFFAALEEQGMAKEEVMSQVETQVKVNKLIADETGEVNPSEEELKEMYDTYVKQLEQMSESGQDVTIPSYEEMKPNLIAQIKSQKDAETYQKLVEKLEKDAEITKNL